jgi:hypothetical protein
MRGLLMVVCLAVVVSSSWAQIPQLVSYQGLLTDSSGAAVDDSVSMVFSIYDAETGGTQIWTEAHSNIPVIEGRFNVLLGGINPLDDSVFIESNRYLGIAVEGDPETQPRIRIGSAPYAGNAGSVRNSSGGSVLLVGSASDTVQINPYSGYAFRMTNDSGDERLIMAADDAEGPTISIKNPNGRYMTLGSGDSTICIYGMDGESRVIIGMEAGDRIDGGGAVSVYDDSSRLAVSVTREGVAIFNSDARSDTVAIFSADGNITSKGWISMGTDSLNGTWSTVFGQNCSGQGTGSTVSGGITNHAVGGVSTISGGTMHSCFGYGATIGGGQNNHADSGSYYSAITGGRANTVFFGDYTTISGGYLNSIIGEGSAIGGGYTDSIDGMYSTISGGNDNKITGPYNTISGGRSNEVNSRSGTIGGGYSNWAGDDDTDTAACIGGGSGNSVTEEFTFIGGGDNNSVSGRHGSIVGGQGNIVSNDVGVICGGAYNDVTGGTSAVVGGFDNQATGTRTFVGGGAWNQANGMYSYVGGGIHNKAHGNYSQAGGRRAVSNHNGVFIWADQKDYDFVSIAHNEFAARSTGGARFVTSVDTSGYPLTGVQVSAGGGSWQSLCDRNSKENVTLINTEELLEKIADLPISSWNYKSQSESIRHISPMAQDFHSAFGVGEDEKHITTIDADGVALAGIQALLDRIERLEARIAELEAERR